MNIAWVIGLTVLGAAVGAAVLILIPTSLVSIFRYQLWRMRDELFDQIQAGLYTEPEQAERLLATIEATIVVLGEMSLWNIALVWLVTRKLTAPARKRFDLNAMPPADRERIKPIHDGLVRVWLSRVFLASWSGLAVLIFGVLPFLVLRAHAADTSHNRLSAVPVEDLLATVSSQHPGRRLSSCV